MAEKEKDMSGPQPEPRPKRPTVEDPKRPDLGEAPLAATFSADDVLPSLAEDFDVLIDQVRTSKDRVQAARILVEGVCMRLEAAGDDPRRLRQAITTLRSTVKQLSAALVQYT